MGPGERASLACQPLDRAVDTRDIYLSAPFLDLGDQAGLQSNSAFQDVVALSSCYYPNQVITGYKG